jgi:hypothetical protein
LSQKVEIKVHGIGRLAGQIGFGEAQFQAFQFDGDSAGTTDDRELGFAGDAAPADVGEVKLHQVTQPARPHRSPVDPGQDRDAVGL